MRAELSPAEEAQHLARRKELWQQLQDSNGKIFPETRREGRPDGFAKDTAAKTGITKRSINQHIARAEALGDDIKRVQGTSLFPVF